MEVKKKCKNKIPIIVLKFPNRAVSSGCLVSVTEASRKRECPSLHVSHPASLSASPVPCPVCQRAPPGLPHGFYLSVSRWVLMLPPSDVVLSTSRVFCFGLYWVGLWWVQTCHLYPSGVFLNRKQSLRG